MELTKQDIKNLKDKKYRREHGIFLVEGEKFCHDLLKTKEQIVATITTNKELKGFPNTIVVNEKVLSSIATTKTNQDIVCVAKIREFDLTARGNSLILDRLQDPGNVGTLIRSAKAFGFDDVYLIDCADSYSEKVVRSSAGTALSIRLHQVSLDEVERNKTKIADVFMVADMFGESISKIRLPKGRIAVIIGNEGQGVCDELKSLADITISIPMRAGVESLNAGVAGSIIMQKISEVNCVRS